MSGDFLAADAAKPLKVPEGVPELPKSSGTPERVLVEVRGVRFVTCVFFRECSLLTGVKLQAAVVWLQSAGQRLFCRGWRCNSCNLEIFPEVQFLEFLGRMRIMQAFKIPLENKQAILSWHCTLQPLGAELHHQTLRLLLRLATGSGPRKPSFTGRLCVFGFCRGTVLCNPKRPNFTNRVCDDPWVAETRQVHALTGDAIRLGHSHVHVQRGQTPVLPPREFYARNLEGQKSSISFIVQDKVNNPCPKVCVPVRNVVWTVFGSWMSVILEHGMAPSVEPENSRPQLRRPNL